MAQQQGEPKQSERPEWLLRPEDVSGISLSIRGVADAPELTPEVLQALGRALEEIQKVQAALPVEGGCPKLTRCDQYSGSCPSLKVCGEFKL